MSISERAKPVRIDGLMLGDGSLKHQNNLVYYIQSSSKRPVTIENHLRELVWVRDNRFTPQGIEVCKGFPKLNTYKIPSLYTRSSLLLVPVWDEWYAGGEWNLSKPCTLTLRGAKKRLPDRIRQYNYVMPIEDLTDWYVGDGGCFERKDGVVQIAFSACCFMAEEVAFLAWQLERYELVTGRPEYRRPKHRKDIDAGRGLLIKLAQESVNDFTDLVEPGILRRCQDCEGTSFRDTLLKRRRTEAGPYFSCGVTIYNVAFERYEQELSRLRAGEKPFVINHPGVPVRPDITEIAQKVTFQELRSRCRGD